MGLLSAAVGAIIAAILEVSVLSQLQLGGGTPELVLAMGVGVAMVAGFEAGMIWAFLGGLMLDMLLPGRALGATTLVLLVAIGIALLVARVTDPPRTVVIAATAFGVSWLYQALLIALLALTAGIGIPELAPTTFTISAIVAAVIAAVTAWATRSLILRFGSAERTDW
jgi:rod shape-determining protein MreD